MKESLARQIISKANRIVRDCETRDALRIAKELDINFMERTFKKQKGLYTVIERNRFILIKQNMHPIQ